MNIRDIINLVEAASATPMPQVFFHASPAKNWERISKHGLVPSKLSQPTGNPRVYLASQQSLAEHYAENGFGVDEHQEWVILAIDASQLDEKLLAPDMDGEWESAWGEITAMGYTEEDEMNGTIPWWVSYQTTGQVIYLDVIPPSAIKLLKKYLP